MVETTTVASSASVATFIRSLAASLVSRRVYVSLIEREAMVAAVAQFVPGYDFARLNDDAATADADRLCAALGDVGREGGISATQVVVAVIQLALADGVIDAADYEIICWVGDSVGLPRTRLEDALALADKWQVEPIGAVPSRHWV
jgi:hypothetical protein